MSTLLFPARHLLHTRFHEQFLLRHLRMPIEKLNCGGCQVREPLDRVVFAVTSANQSHSRYNPVPLHLRAIGIDRLGRRLRDSLGIDYQIVPVPHFRPTERFAENVLKELDEATEGRLELHPDDTVVLTSTVELISQFRGLGFTVLTGEYDESNRSYRVPLALEVLKRLAEIGDDWPNDPSLREMLSMPTFSVWEDFPDLPRTIIRLFRDPLLTDSGSLTEMRNYSVYSQGMNNAAILELKYRDIKDAIVAGKIADEGCADGALLVPIARDFADSDLVGIEITGEFMARCIERQRAMEFGGTYIHFHQRNITEPVFEPASIDTTICNSTTHELWSYGDQAQTLRPYLREKFRQTRTNGRIIIRDVVGPEDGGREVYMWCSDADGGNDLGVELGKLSTAARFRRFAEDWLKDLRDSKRRTDGRRVSYREETLAGKKYVVLALADAMEFLMKKDYVDNWRSEMNEEFAFWSFSDWKRELEEAGFKVHPLSRAYTNQWIVDNRWKGKVELWAKEGEVLVAVPWAATNMVLVGSRALGGGGRTMGV
jgi:hypothetical protein